MVSAGVDDVEDKKVRLIVKYHEDKPYHANVACDLIEREDGMVFAYNGDALVGVFDLGIVDMMYLSEERN